VRKRHPEEQLHQAWCLTMVTNAVIYWNTVYMQATVDEWRAKGFELHEEDLAHIYPVRFAHINTHGKLHFPSLDDTLPRRYHPLRNPDAAKVPQIIDTPKQKAWVSFQSGPHSSTHTQNMRPNQQGGAYCHCSD
jgi:hypothetical protein